MVVVAVMMLLLLLLQPLLRYSSTTRAGCSATMPKTEATLVVPVVLQVHLSARVVLLVDVAFFAQL